MLLGSWSIPALSFYVIYYLKLADLNPQGKQRISYLIFQHWEWGLGVGGGGGVEKKLTEEGY